MNDKQVECFLVTARTLSFTKTAEILFYSPQAVARYVANLEDELNAPLFERHNHKGLALTKSGELCIELFEKQREMIDRAKNTTASRYQKICSNLSIGYSAGINPFGEINAGIKSFRAEYPGVHVSGRQYWNEALSSELINKNLDLALISDGQLLLPVEFERFPFADDELTLLVPAEVCGGGPNVKLDPKCWDLPFVLAESWMREWGYIERKEIIASALNNLGLQPRRIVFMPNIYSVFANMKVYPCVTFDDRIFGYGSKIDGICHVPLHMKLRWNIIWHRLNDNPLIRAFLEHMREAYGFKEERSAE